MNALNHQLREELMALCSGLGADLKERGQRTMEAMYDERRFFRGKWVSAIAVLQAKVALNASQETMLSGGLQAENEA